MGDFVRLTILYVVAWKQTHLRVVLINISFETGELAQLPREMLQSVIVTLCNTHFFMNSLSYLLITNA